VHATTPGLKNRPTVDGPPYQGRDDFCRPSNRHIHFAPKSWHRGQLAQGEQASVSAFKQTHLKEADK
jgi:hypothetical protein